MAAHEVIDPHLILIELELVCRAYGPGKIRQVSTPNLEIVAGRLQLSREELIDSAVAEIGDDRYRATAHQLLVDPEVRHSNLMQRTRLAAAEFGVGVDAFRRVPRGDGLSSRSMVLLEAAQNVVDLDAGAMDHTSLASGSPVVSAEPDKVLTQQVDEIFDDLSNAFGRSGPGRRSLWLGAVAAVACLAVVAVLSLRTEAAEVSSISLAGEVDVSLQCVAQAGPESIAVPDAGSSGWVCNGPGEQREPADIQEACDYQYGTESVAQNLAGNNSSWRCVTHFPVESGEDCPVGAGAFNPSSSDIHSPFAAGFRRRFEEAGGSEVLGCPTQLLHHWVAGPIQELATKAGSESAILAVDADSPILLTGTAWSAFDRVKGLTGELVGFPTTEPYERDGIYLVDLSAGGGLLAGSEDAHYYWVPPIVLLSWDSMGGPDSCVGLPISDPYAGASSFKQDFEAGSFSLSVLTGEVSHTGDGC